MTLLPDTKLFLFLLGWIIGALAVFGAVMMAWGVLRWIGVRIGGWLLHPADHERRHEFYSKWEEYTP